MKKIRIMSLYIVVVIMMITSFSRISFAAKIEPIKVTIDGQQIQFDVPPANIDGRVLVPFRTIFESLGAEVIWINEDKIAIGTSGNSGILLQIGNKNAIILKLIGSTDDNDYALKYESIGTLEGYNGYDLELDVAPAIIMNKTMVPARVVAETLGCDVKWNSTSHVVEILTPVGLEKKLEENKNLNISEQLIGNWSNIESHGSYIDSFGFYVRGSHSATALEFNTDGTFTRAIVASGAFVTGHIYTKGKYKVHGDKILCYDQRESWNPDLSHKGQRDAYVDKSMDDKEYEFHFTDEGKLVFDSSTYDLVN